MNYRPHPLTKDELVKLYVEEKKSTLQVAKELGTSQVTVCKYLKLHGIEARPFSTKGLQTRLGAVLSQETREKIAKAHKGKKLSPAHRRKVIKTLIRGKEAEGERNPNWQGGLTEINKKIQNRLRKTTEMRLWRKVVLERDENKCVLCGTSEEMLHVDHIKPFALYPELRTSIENGRTLCIKCHRKTPTYGNKKGKIT